MACAGLLPARHTLALRNHPRGQILLASPSNRPVDGVTERPARSQAASSEPPYRCGARSRISTWSCGKLVVPQTDGVTDSESGNPACSKQCHWNSQACAYWTARARSFKGPAESGQICSVGRRKIAKKIAKIEKNKRCYANTLRPRSRMLLKVMKGG